MYLFVAKVSIPMIVLLDLKRLNCHLKVCSLANSQVVPAQIGSIHMLLKYGMSLDARRLHIITISICSWMCCF